MRRILLATALSVSFVSVLQLGHATTVEVLPVETSSSPVPSDSLVQQQTAAVLADGMRRYGASGGAVVVLDVHTGQIVSLVSLVDATGGGEINPGYNRAINNVHELGSVMMIFPVVQALNEGLADPDSLIDTPEYLPAGRHFQIRDYRRFGEQLSLSDVFVRSSNVGVAQIARMIGGERQRDFLGTLGFLEPTYLEVSHPTEARSVVPERWDDVTVLTLAYGHGLSASPLQLAAAYASVVNGGYLVRPTLTANGAARPQIITEASSAQVRLMLREFVERGSGNLADVPGYSVGGRTGSANLALLTGGYSDKRVVSTFVAVFPTDAPEYVVVTMLEDAIHLTDDGRRRSAGWTSAPLTAEIIARVGPILLDQASD